MKSFKWISRVLAFAVAGGWAAWAAAAPFTDLPENHWAREAVERLSAKGVLKGYGDGTFKGGKSINRYEVAMVINKLIEAGGLAGGIESVDAATLHRLVSEFSEELAVISSRVGNLESDLKKTAAEVKSIKGNGDFGKVQISGDMRLRFQKIVRPVDTIETNDWPNHFRLGLNFKMNVDDNVKAYVRFLRDEIMVGEIGAGTPMVFDEAYIDVKDFFNFGDLRLGRQWMSVGHSIVMDDKLDGIKFSKMIDRVGLTMFAFSTRATNSGINDQHYGNATGTKTYYMFSDTRSIDKGKGAVNPVTGAGLNGGTPLAAFTPGDDITLYATPYGYPRPYDDFLGTKTGINGGAADWTYNTHSGIALQGGYGVGGGDLAPVSLPIGAAATGIRASFPAIATGAIYNYIAPTGVLDTAGTDGQVPAGVTRDWQLQSAAGLDSWGLNVACDFGGHNLTAYYIQRNYDRFDPYTRMGDPWAAMVDYNNDKVADVDINGNDLSPAADPSYLGFTLDGTILKNLDYFFEFVTFDPDINNIGVDPRTGIATTAAGEWKGNNLDTGNAWILGLDWDITKDYSLLIQYGVGDEEFIPVSIYEGKMLNGMYGRTNNDDGSVGGTFNYVEGQYSLTGIKDLVLKLSAKFNPKSSGYVKYEIAKDNDSSAERLIAGDPSVTGHPSQDYRMLSFLFKHQYTPRTTIVLQLDTLEYDDAAVNESTRINREDTNADDANYGGWDWWGRVNISIKI